MDATFKDTTGVGHQQPQEHAGKTVLSQQPHVLQPTGTAHLQHAPASQTVLNLQLVKDIIKEPLDTPTLLPMVLSVLSMLQITQTRT